MTLALTNINIGAAPNDGTGDPARTAFGYINTNNAAIETAVNAYTLTLLVETVANQDYVLSYDMSFAGSITAVRAKTQSGACTVTAKIGSTALGGTANAASVVASEQAHSSSNTFAIGATLLVTVSANASAEKLQVTFKGAKL